MTRVSAACVLLGTLICTSGPGSGAPQAGSSLEAAFARMDEAAAVFKGLTADIRQQSHTEVVDTNDVEEGTIVVKRFKPKDTRILIRFTDGKSYSIGDGKYRSFNSKTQEAQEADLGNSKDIVNQLMLLGFGSNSGELKAAYTIKLGGPDVVNGERTVRLEMVPKSADILKHVKRCDRWISEKGVAIQQKFFETGGDYVLATYTNVVVNPTVPDSAVKLDFPKGVKVTKLK